MPKLKLALIVSLVTSLSACGGGGDGGNPPLPVNAAPVASNVSITDDNGGDALTGDGLTGSYTYADADNDAEGASTFRWLRDGMAINGATASTVTLISADAGTEITFEVTPVAAAGTTTGNAVTSAGITVEVANVDLASLSVTGAVYVFARDGAGLWTQAAYLKASNAEFNDQFGISVALSGDTLAVGADREDSNGSGGPMDKSANGAGAVYVFTRDGAGLWTQAAYLKASNAEANDFFGQSVALSGDTLAVVAYFEDSNGSGETDNSAGSAGAAYV